MADILTLLAALAELRDEQDALLRAQADAIPTKLRAELARIAKRFAPDLEHVATELELRTVQVKAAVLAHGASVKGDRLQAVYVAGRPAWDDRGLRGFALVHPEVLGFRTEGAPSVTLRAVAPPQEAA